MNRDTAYFTLLDILAPYSSDAGYHKEVAFFHFYIGRLEVKSVQPGTVNVRMMVNNRALCTYTTSDLSSLTTWCNFLVHKVTGIVKVTLVENLLNGEYHEGLEQVGYLNQFAPNWGSEDFLDIADLNFQKGSYTLNSNKNTRKACWVFGPWILEGAYYKGVLRIGHSLNPAYDAAIEPGFYISKDLNKVVYCTEEHFEGVFKKLCIGLVCSLLQHQSHQEKSE